MKKYAVPIIVVLAVLALTLSTFSRAADRAGQGRRGQNMSEEERAKRMERFRNMSPEEQAKFRQQMAARGGARGSRVSREDREKAVKVIEEQLAKFKAAAQVQMPQRGSGAPSQEEITKIRAAYADRRTALQTIVAQVALLEGRRQPEGEGARFMIINTMELKPIQEAATKEKATETGKLLERMIARGTGRGFGGRGGSRQGGGAAPPRRGNQ